MEDLDYGIGIAFNSKTGKVEPINNVQPAEETKDTRPAPETKEQKSDKLSVPQEDKKTTQEAPQKTEPQKTDAYLKIEKKTRSYSSIYDTK